MGRSGRLKGILAENAANLAALAAGAALFALSFPNAIFAEGLPWAAWVAFAPVFWVARRAGAVASVFLGAAYGYMAYGLFNSWLGAFHPLAGVIVYTIYAAYFAILLPLLRLAARLFPMRGYAVQWLLWMGYEYLRTTGFLGYPYGISGYSQWGLWPLIQIADIFGVWGVSALVVFPSAWLAWAIPARAGSVRGFARREAIAAAAWALGLAAALAYGFSSKADYSGSPTVRLSLIQHDTNPWHGGLDAYRENLRILRSLSDQALAAERKPDLVVWSETAFVPRIHWHSTYREDPEYYALVKEFLDYTASTGVPFLIGNDDARRETDAAGEQVRVDYNAAVLFAGGKEAGVYRKNRLVPFTEHFPYGRLFPRFHRYLSEADTHFWKKGTESPVLQAAGARFGTPICFEDGFGYISRSFVGNGAQLIVNLTNDAWARSLPCQMQHMGLAVFRAVENRRALVRATNSGQTCLIDPNGVVTAMAEPFSKAFLTIDVPLYSRDSLYTRLGDWLALAFVAAAAAAIAGGLAAAWLRARREAGRGA